MGGIYVLTNKTNDKKYVGVSYGDIDARVKRHFDSSMSDNQLVNRRIQFYGADNWDVEIIPYPGASKEALQAIEKWKIQQYGSHVTQHGYNKSWGGEPFADESVKEIAQNRSREHSRELLDKGTHPFQNPDVREKAAEGSRNRNQSMVAEGTHPFQKHNFKGKRGRKPGNPQHHSDETKRKISEGLKRYWENKKGSVA